MSRRLPRVWTGAVADRVPAHAARRTIPDVPDHFSQEVDQRINEVDAEAESKRQAAAEVAADAESRRGAAGDAANLKYEVRVPAGAAREVAHSSPRAPIAPTGM